MGVGSSQPVYNLVKLQDFQHLDTLPVRYLWIDMKIASRQNQTYLKTFRDVVNLEEYSEFSTLQKTIGMINKTKERIRILCSASLPDHVYEYISSNDAVQRGFLFCSSRTKAGILMGSYPKIKTACFGYEQVLRTFKAWQQDQVETIYFFEEKDISKLHRASVNWHTLTDIDASVTPEIRDVFMQFCNKILKEQAPVLMKELQSSKIKQSASLVTYAMEDNFLLREVNYLLRATKNPAKLAYIRWPVIELYKFIKDRYADIKNKGTLSLYGLITLNSEEKRRLQPGRCINIIQFIKTTLSVPNKSKEETLIEIKVSASKQICNGYYTASQGALFNIGNFYQIEAYNPDQNTLTVSLLAFDKNQPIKQHDLRSSVLINQLMIQKLQAIKEGQWYSLLLGGFSEGAKEYLSRISKIQSKKRDDKETIKCFVLREKVKVRLGSPLQKSIEKLDKICKQYHADDQILIYILVTISQLTLLARKYAKFLSTFIELSRTLDCLKIKKVTFPIPNQKIELLQIAFEMIENKDKKEILKGVARSIDQFESNLLKTDNHTIASGIYLLCLQVKAQCYDLLENYKVELQVLDRMLWIYGHTWGHEHHEFKMAQQNKKLAFEKQNKQMNEIDLLLKKQLQTSNVITQQLLPIDTRLKLDISNIDLSIYS